MVYTYPSTLENRHSYATLAQLKDPGWLNITDTLSDTTLLSILETASKAIDTYCHRFFYLCEDTRYFDGKSAVMILDDDLYSLTAMKVDPTGSGSFDLTYDPTITPPDFYMYPLNRTPTTTLEINWNGQYGTFYAGFRSNVQIQGVWGHGPDVYQNAFEDSGYALKDAITTTYLPTVDILNPLNLSPGMTIRIDKEQMYILTVVPASNDITVQRATMGTTGVSHLVSTEIYVAQYPQAVVRATLIKASQLYKSRLGGSGTVGNAITGEAKTEEDKEMEKLLKPYIRERVATWVGS